MTVTLRHQVSVFLKRGFKYELDQVSEAMRDIFTNSIFNEEVFYVGCQVRLIVNVTKYHR